MPLLSEEGQRGHAVQQVLYNHAHIVGNFIQRRSEDLQSCPAGWIYYSFSCSSLSSSAGAGWGMREKEDVLPWLRNTVEKLINYHTEFKLFPSEKKRKKVKEKKKARKRKKEEEKTKSGYSSSLRVESKWRDFSSSGMECSFVSRCPVLSLLFIHSCVYVWTAKRPNRSPKKTKTKTKIHCNGTGTNNGRRHDNQRNKNKCQKPPIWGNPR